MVLFEIVLGIDEIFLNFDKFFKDVLSELSFDDVKKVVLLIKCYFKGKF